MKRISKLLILLLLLFIFLVLNGCLDKTEYEYTKIKYLLEDLFTYYHEEDLDNYMDCWSLFSPYREAEKERVEQFFNTYPYFNDVLFGYYVDEYYLYEEERALLKFTYIIGDSFQGKGTMILRKEGSDWRVWKIDW